MEQNLAKVCHRFPSPRGTCGVAASGEAKAIGSLLLTIQFLLLGTVFVVTSGAVFTEWGRQHKALVFLASIVAIIASAYLIRDIYGDLKHELWAELDRRTKTDAIQPPTEPSRA